MKSKREEEIGKGGVAGIDDVGKTSKTICFLAILNFMYRISSLPDGKMVYCVCVCILQSTHGFLQQSTGIINSLCKNPSDSDLTVNSKYCKILGKCGELLTKSFAHQLIKSIFLKMTKLKL